jgi:serine/threonine protein kinase/regulation of enolase protein 1 (concanavalin A-like superfamily)
MSAGGDARGAGSHRGRRAEEIVTFELVPEDDAGDAVSGAGSQTARNSQEIVRFEIVPEDDAGDGSQTARNSQEVVTFTLVDPAEDAGGARHADNDVANASIVVSLDEFVRAVTELDLATAAELKTLTVDPAAGVAGLSRRLINAGKLTRHQAAALCQNKSRSLLIGNYLILDELGPGGIGPVFKARHRQLGSVGALKTLPAALARDQNAVMRVRRDLEAAGQLNHPNLVAAFDADLDGGVPFIVMDHVAGRDLGLIVRERGPMQANLAIECLIQAARGLAAAHAQGICHHHIKPSKLMLDKKAGAVRVTGVGLAAIIEPVKPITRDTRVRQTGSGTGMGTPDYLAPEQAQGSQGGDHRADIYSLGCTLYFLLTGEQPFPGETAQTRLTARVERPTPPLRTTRPDVPAVLEAAYLKMVAKRPDERPSSMTEVIALLEASKTAIAANDARGSAPGKSPRELLASSEKSLKQAGPRGSKPDPSVFARPGQQEGLWFDPDLDLEDLVTDARPEAPPIELPAALRPPISRQPLPARLEMTGSRRRSNGTGLALIAILAIAAVTALFFSFHLFSGSRSGNNTADRAGGNVAADVKDRSGIAVAAQPAPKAITAPAAQAPGAGPNRVAAAPPAPRAGSTSVVLGQSSPAVDRRAREIAGWGLAIDPDGDCQINGDRTTLSITVPPTLHDLSADVGKYNAPRVVRDVEGDFEVEVRVEGDFRPGSICNRPGGIPFVGGGIVICDGGDNFIRLERGIVYDQGSLSPYAIFQQHIAGRGAAVHDGPLNAGTTYLRLARRGGTIRGFTSSDGRYWSELEPIRGVRTAKLQVGVDAINSGNAPFTVRFEQLSFKTGARGGARR